MCITEKPMTTTSAKAQRILDACKRNDRHVRVLFNYRYSPPRTQVKDLLMNGEIGDVLSVDFHWLLNTQHGADYFRRWHSQQGNLRRTDGAQGDSSFRPGELVAGRAARDSSGVRQARVLHTHHGAAHGTEVASRALPHMPGEGRVHFLSRPRGRSALKALYLDNEHYDGYFRDQCVFRPEIDIEDTMNVIVRYDTGATLSYSLNACNSWEGYQIAFNGTRGRLEHEMVEQIYVAGANMTQGAATPDGVRTRIIPLRGAPREIEPWTASGGHGGGDEVMLNDIFGIPAVDPYKRASDERSGAYSILIGAAANRCFETGQAVRIAELVTGLTPPDMAPMPTRAGSVPMPRRVDL